MKIFTFLFSALLLATGGFAYFEWESLGFYEQSFTLLVPAFFGIALLLAGIVSLKQTQAGVKLAILAAFPGVFVGLGRLAPGYVKETLDYTAPDALLALALAVLCFLYTFSGALFLLVALFRSQRDGADLPARSSEPTHSRSSELAISCPLERSEGQARAK